MTPSWPRGAGRRSTSYRRDDAEQLAAYAAEFGLDAATRAGLHRRYFGDLALAAAGEGSDR
jgi:hypothetical protein